MISRIRNALGLALLPALVISLAVSAKGGFSFIAIVGPGIDEEVRATGPELTEEFFAFADFYRDKVEAPADPGKGYEITRYYIDGRREIAFDQLHYYPDSGFVFYDGILNGDSEYDGEWYAANPAIKTVFENTLLVAINARPQSDPPVGKVAPNVPKSQNEPAATLDPSRIVMPILVLSGLAVLFLWLARVRKSAIH
jgi:hypothetical protein